MACSKCGSQLPITAGRCIVCGSLEVGGPQVGTGVLTPLPTISGVTGAQAIAGGDLAATIPAPGVVRSAAGPLTAGQSFGERYHILRLLGTGGMGAVYQAWDRELGVALALKVIRPEVLKDPAAAADLERRFKRELLLARQVTHKNVVRIHDLGELEGVKYLTMPYVEGADLASILKRDGCLPVNRACSVATQILAGLAAAHEAGVVHRDLKPANVMIGPNDHTLIMDFGIARSTSGTGGGTVLGGVVGTLEYMAPEQARGVPVDHRADIYAFGLILRDMLVGLRHRTGPESAVVELMNRMQQAPPSIRSIDPTIPEALDHVIQRCTQPGPDDRYQSADDVAADFQRMISGAPVLAAVSAGAVPAASRRQWAATGKNLRLPIAAVLIILALVGGVSLWRNRLPGRPDTAAAAPQQTTTLAILPFRNASADPAMEWLSTGISEMLSADIGQSAALKPVSSDRLHQVLADLRIAPGSVVDRTARRRVADFSGAGVVVSGQFVRLGNVMRIDATVDGLTGGLEPREFKADVRDAALLEAVGTLAKQIRESLATAGDGGEGEAYKPASQSVAALKEYNEGLLLGRHGRHADAQKRFEAAIQHDPAFALAYSKLGETFAALRYGDRAEEAAQKAVELSDELPPLDRYAVRALHARIRNDRKTAADAYQQMLALSPNDPAIHFQLAGLRESEGVYDAARDHLAKVLERDPKFVSALLAMGRVEIRRRNPQGALEFLNRALTLAIQLEHNDVKADILQALGVGYKRLNKPEEALKYYQDSLEIKTRLGNKGGMASSLNEIAQVHQLLGRPDAALASYTEALKIRQEIKDRTGEANVLLDLGRLHQDRGQYEQALTLQKQALVIQREVGNLNYEALCLNNIGGIYLELAQHSEALTYLERALEIRKKLNVPDSLAETLHNLAETRVKMGDYEQALKDYVEALNLRRSTGNRRAAAIELFSMGTLYEQQGRYGAAVKSKAEAVQMFRELQDRSVWLGEILAGYGNSLSLVGDVDGAKAVLDESLTIARQLQNQPLVARVLNFQGDRLFYAGSVAGARGLFEQALRVASKSGDKPLILLSKLNLAKIAAWDAPAPAVRTLTALREDAEGLGLKYVSAEASVYLTEALVRSKRHQQAQQEGTRAIARCQEMGLQVLLAKTHLALARTGSPADATAASRHLDEAKKVLEGVRTETGRDGVVKRADLSRWL